MVLEPGGQRIRTFRFAGAGFSWHIDIVVDQHTVVPHADAGVCDLLAILIVPRSAEHDVIRLPLERWQRHVHIRRSQPIEGAGSVVRGEFGKRIQNLHFVATLQIHTTVGPSLPAGGGHVRQAELHMQTEVAVGLLRVGSYHQPMLTGQPGVVEQSGRCPIEQHHGSRRRWRTQSGADPLDPRQPAGRFAGFRPEHLGATAVDANHQRPRFQNEHPAVALSGKQLGFGSIPTAPGQTADIEQPSKGAFSLCGHLQTGVFGTCRRSREPPGILSLKGEVLVRLAGIGNRRVAIGREKSVGRTRSAKRQQECKTSRT